MDLCRLLAQEGIVPQKDAEEVRASAQRNKRPVLQEIIQRRILTSRQLFELLIAKVNLPLAHLDRLETDPDVLRKISQEAALHYRVLPLGFAGPERDARLNVAVADPFCRECFDELESTYGCPVEPSLADADELTAAINRHYGQVVTRVMSRHPAAPSPEDPEETEEAEEAEETEEAEGRPDQAKAGPRFLEPSTVPTHNIEDEATPSLKVRALLNLFVAKGWITEEEYVQEVRRLLEEEGA